MYSGRFFARRQKWWKKMEKKWVIEPKHRAPCALAIGIYINRSITEDSLRRYAFHASQNCTQELLSASSDSSGVDDEWKVVSTENGFKMPIRFASHISTSSRKSCRHIRQYYPYC